MNTWEDRTLHEREKKMTLNVEKIDYPLVFQDHDSGPGSWHDTRQPFETVSTSLKSSIFFSARSKHETIRFIVILTVIMDSFPVYCKVVHAIGYSETVID